MSGLRQQLQPHAPQHASVAGKPADGVERMRKSANPGRGHPAPRRSKTEDAAVTGRCANRATGITAQTEVAQSCRHGHCGSGGGTARDAACEAQAHRVVSQRERRVRSFDAACNSTRGHGKLGKRLTCRRLRRGRANCTPRTSQAYATRKITSRWTHPAQQGWPACRSVRSLHSTSTPAHPYASCHAAMRQLPAMLLRRAPWLAPACESRATWGFQNPSHGRPRQIGPWRQRWCRRGGRWGRQQRLARRRCRLHGGLHARVQQVCTDEAVDTDNSVRIACGGRCRPEVCCGVLMMPLNGAHHSTYHKSKLIR